LFRYVFRSRVDCSGKPDPYTGFSVAEKTSLARLSPRAIREVKEETGFDIRIERIVGIYSDPGHVFDYSDGEVRQEFSICLACTIVGGKLAVSHESTDVRFFAVDEVPGLTMHPSIRKRIDDYLAGGEPRLK
jgi:8-oxo-dGTP pyrophosphatase MutT (NUDIX family)